MSNKKPSATEIEAINNFIINPLEEFGFHFHQGYKNKMSKLYLEWIQDIHSVLDKTKLSIRNKIIRGFYFRFFRDEFIIAEDPYTSFHFNRITDEGIKKYHEYFKKLNEKKRQVSIKRTKKILMKETIFPEDIINLIVEFY
jgi:ERCC4-related helicase